MKFAVFWCALFATLGSVWADDLPELGDVSQTTITPQQERQLGEQIMREIRASREYLDDPEVSDYINALGYKLASNSPNPSQEFEFFVLSDKTVNAFALPGGFINVNSGLIQTAQSESELAAVLAHEISHVTQHHIARLFNQQKQAGLASLAAIALAILAARTSPDLAQAAAAAGQYATYQTAVNFTRDNEREADRIGIQILEKSGYDPHAMPAFLERLQRAYRLVETNAPSYARTHPLTSERIADAENRVQDIPYRQIPDSLEFQLVRARLHARALSPRDAVAYFDDILIEKKAVSDIPARYGLILALLSVKDYKRALREADTLLSEAGQNAMVVALVGRAKAAAGDLRGALDLFSTANKRFLRSREITYEYARVLLDSKRPMDALQVVLNAQESGRPDYRLYELQAESYAALGQKLQQHRALAEAYVAMGILPAAIEQLQIGLRAGDGDFYQMSSAESRLKELRARDAERRRQERQ
ncbi:MAG TPA: M48 family metalloprotease [Burkholderiales bacterium]|nr:M48 family metalloprotease [Burkholderiales bacterium]